MIRISQIETSLRAVLIKFLISRYDKTKGTTTAIATIATSSTAAAAAAITTENCRSTLPRPVMSIGTILGHPTYSPSTNSTNSYQYQPNTYARQIHARGVVGPHGHKNESHGSMSHDGQNSYDKCGVEKDVLDELRRVSDM